MASTYLVIDLKSFYASVECVRRNLNSLTTKLVVADKSRGSGSICLAVSPKLKELGVKNRCRLYEIPKEIDYIIAKPMMADYIKVSADIYSIYLKYIAKEDIYVYSIDEVFIDVTSYLELYQTDPYSLAKKMIDDVYNTTGICATVGIGTNMFLAKVALDITAKHEKSHMGYLDEDRFKALIWEHKPITDIWNIGSGIAKRLEKYNCYTLRDVTKLDEKILYKEFGKNALFLIDHAYGKESCTIEMCKNYKSKSKSISHSQVLDSDYKYDDALLVVKEMVETAVLELIDKHLICGHVSLRIGYTKNKIMPTGMSMKLYEHTASLNHLREDFIKMFKKTTDENVLIRQISLGFGDLILEENQVYNLFSDVKSLEKEQAILKTIVSIKNKYGKDSIVRGHSLEEKATTLKRNKLIGGHNAR